MEVIDPAMTIKALGHQWLTKPSNNT